jgi:hypothetical protein
VSDRLSPVLEDFGKRGVAPQQLTAIVSRRASQPAREKSSFGGKSVGFARLSSTDGIVPAARDRQTGSDSEGSAEWLAPGVGSSKTHRKACHRMVRVAFKGRCEQSQDKRLILPRRVAPALARAWSTCSARPLIASRDRGSTSNAHSKQLPALLCRRGGFGSVESSPAAHLKIAGPGAPPRRRAEDSSSVLAGRLFASARLARSVSKRSRDARRFPHRVAGC